MLGIVVLANSTEDNIYMYTRLLLESTVTHHYIFKFKTRVINKYYKKKVRLVGLLAIVCGDDYSFG